MVKWILLGLALAGGLIGGIIALSGGSGGGGSGHSDSTVLAQNTNNQTPRDENVQWDKFSDEHYYDNEDWETSNGETYHKKHRKDPPDMVPAPAPLLGDGLIQLAVMLGVIGLIRFRRHSKK